MLSRKLILTRLWPLALLCLLLSVASAHAQQPTPTPAEQSDEVLRISTDLVQTDLMVFDKDGRFVNDLKREQFELRVDGKPQEISFFDIITAGSASEEAKLAAARGASRPATETNTGSVGVLDRGRIVVFFVNDLHLNVDSLRRTKKTLLHFINEEMGQNDEVAIAATSGQIGFLQQLTNNKTVLRAAVERLGLHPQLMGDGQRPPMSEYLAQEIMVRFNRDVTNYFVEAMIKDGFPPSPNLEEMVRSRARAILDQSNAVTRNVFFSLESLTRTLAPLPGRKLIFFISDGFLLNTSQNEINQKLLSLTNVATRNGIVIYTMDARGLVVDPTMDASQPSAVDNTGRIQTAAFGELTAMQESLRTIADNTGGRALLNSNSLDAGITKTLKETSTYYVISWRPESEEQKSDKLRRIEVKIKGRSDLVVQVKRGYLGPPKKPAATKSAPAAEAKNSKPKTPADEIRNAISAFYPTSALETALALDYQDAPQVGATLTIWMEVQADPSSFVPVEGKHRATMDVGGFVYNDKGQPGASFQQRITITADSLDSLSRQQRSGYFSSKVQLAPGLYQVRVAARDEKTGRIGSAIQWIEIPDLKKRQLAMSSLLVGETTAADLSGGGDATGQKATINVARTFARSSRLRFLAFIYNAARGDAGTNPPDVAVQIQVMRDNQPVLTTALKKIEPTIESDLSRLPYAAEIPLSVMSAGRYQLRVTAIDRIAKSSTSQEISFEVE